ncbi:LysR family transcriptional regulator [Xylophilus sp.]|uniref:LysR family transcriptional regulator n=1 Tax=Xylophilus sp. TaxID=2653893 RepID=UPI0013B90A48|nr:LysR family transcriptional regulator [Xylophilus sp.]KAF1046753.1 MAG: Glycine cleavage system transcriptional activator [Xylophilus sp.]
MSTLRRQLPQLQSLVYFESAARHLNFTAAAEELGTTQPAVSHRVKRMEEDLGVPLFRRQHRGVALTDEGQRLYRTVRESLEALRLTTAEVRVREERPSLVLATDFGCAKFWLLPRIPALRAAIPGLQLRVITSQEEVDPRQVAVDFSIHFGGPGGDAERLFAETVVPVCSPALLRRHGPVRGAADLARLPLLHLQQVEPIRWMDWSEWFAAEAAGRPTEAARQAPHLLFNDYSMVVQAAVGGDGVALGWSPLVDELLDRGELAVAWGRPRRTARGYFLRSPRGAAAAGGIRARFRDWLLAECTAGVKADAARPAARAVQQALCA